MFQNNTFDLDKIFSGSVKLKNNKKNIYNLSGSYLLNFEFILISFKDFFFLVD
ncbi:hypothetical protein LEP1GSC005_1413 [Leptospira santarosai str. ST188]|nr:hypothetical protein LEP1GSC005_1413 [Leptospira santarosai str. ST188]EMJ50241.1 hypothetical protein LEP1GSC169_1867 [Leptospira santarosai str. HAI1349]EMM85087.1 hypothetical protein LEP1GSC039_0457 [Leptospira santarosai str. 2000027870]